jgi:hypothetical protein
MTSPQTARDLGHLILTLRGQRVLLDSDLAALMGFPPATSTRPSGATSTVSRRTSCSNCIPRRRRL